jgi:hypothetical protein
VQVPKLSERRDVDLGFGPDFVPDRLEPHAYDRVKVLELSVSDVYILQIEVLSQWVRQGKLPGHDNSTHQRVVPLQLD